jgi:hypothetical protein
VIGQQSLISFSLKRREVRHHQLQTIKLSKQFDLQPWRQRFAIPSAQLLKTLAAMFFGLAQS